MRDNIDSFASERLQVSIAGASTGRLRSHVIGWLAVLLALIGGLMIGWMLAGGSIARDGAAATRAIDALGEAQQSIALVSGEYQALLRATEVDRIAATDSRNTIGGLQARIDQLQEDVVFYKSIMAPSDINRGLQVKDFVLSATDSPRKFNYRLVLTQVSNNEQYIQGMATLSLKGRRTIPTESKDEQTGDSEILSLRDLTGSDKLGIKFRFRYFQNMEGEFTIPEHFEPQETQVVAQVKGRSASKAEQTFTWSAGK